MGRGRSNSSRGRHKTPSRSSRPPPGVGDAAAALSDSSLNEELLDYLENINKQKQDSSAADGTPSQQPLAGASGSTPVPVAAEHSGLRAVVARAEDDDPDNWRPSGLGYHPVHGFASATAAAHFADTSLDNVLEGDLANDLQQDDTSGSSSSSDDSASTSSDTGSSDSEADDNTARHTGLGFDPSLPIVVDATGKPQQRWHDLSLQERYPVQARHEQPPRSPALAGSSSKSSRQRQPPRARDVLVANISTSMLLSNRTGSVPEFQSEALTAVVAAVTTAAADVARQHVAQYAELAQQLQQAQQNPNKRPGSRGRGAKKQLKKAKVAAKRNVREARSEAGALQLLAAFEIFAGNGQDMQVLPPCGSKQKEGFAKQLARLFGISASSQGGGSSGRTCMVLSATADTQAQLDGQALQQLQVLLKAELAKELAASTIARDDTVAVLKKKEKQHRRSSTQHAGMQRQGSRGTPGTRAPPPDYQAPVLFVAAGLLDPNSSLLDHDEYCNMRQQAAAAAVESHSSSSSSSSSESDASASAGKGVGDRSVQGRGRVGPNHAQVGAFLEALLLQEEGQDPAAAAGLAEVAAAAGVAEGPLLQAATTAQGAGATKDAAAAAAAEAPMKGGSDSAAADRQGAKQQQQQQQQSEASLQQAAEPAWFIDRTGGSSGDSPTGRTGLGFASAAAAAAAATGPDTQQEFQQPAPAASAADAAAFVPTWFEDRAPTRTVYSLGSRGMAFIAAGTGDDDLPRTTRHPAPPPPPAAAAAAAAAAGASVPANALGDGDGAGLVYSRAGVGLGLGATAGLGSAAAAAAAAASTDAGLGQQQQQQDSDDDGDGSWILAGLGSSNRRSRRSDRAAGSAGGGGGGGGGSSGGNKLAQLEAEFKSLQVPGGRAALAAAAAQSKAEEKQRRREQQQHQASRGARTLEESIAAVEASAAAPPTFNLTAQQTKKAKRKQQRNQRREANRSGAADGVPAAAAGAAPAVLQQQQQQQQDVGFATFEVHTTGIGSRLLSAWGWNEGEGLGRARQGRAEPLRAERRPKQLGLGYE